MIRITGTPDELRQRAVTLMREQGARAYSSGNQLQCVYYDPETEHRCGVGLLVSADDANELACEYPDPVSELIKTGEVKCDSMEAAWTLIAVQALHDDMTAFAAMLRDDHETVDHFWDGHYELAQAELPRNYFGETII